MGNDGIFWLTIENDRRANDRRKNYRTPWDSIVLVKKFLCLPKTIVSQALFLNGESGKYKDKEGKGCEIILRSCWIRNRNRYWTFFNTYFYPVHP